MVNPPLPEASGKRDSVITEKNWKILLAGLSGAVLLFTFYCLANGITTIFMHLYYFPIILLAYHYQRTGVLLSALLGVFYVALVTFYTYPAIQEIAGAIVRFWVFVGISLVVAYLSFVLARQQISRQTLFDRAGGGILYVNRQDLIITEANPHFLNMLGYDRNDLIGIVLGTICTFSGGDILTPKTFGPTTPDESREVRLRAKDNSEKIAIISVGELPDEQYVLIVTDITGEIQLQKKNRQLNVLQENIIANASVWLMVLNARGKVLIWNRAAEEISGYPAEETVGNADIWKKLYPDQNYRRTVTKEVDDIIETDNYLRNFETTIITKSGEKKSIMWNTRALSVATAEGEEGFVAIGVEISALKKSELEFNAIFSQTFQLIALLNPEGIVLKMNQTALDFEGINESEITGKNLCDTPSMNNPPEERIKVQDAIFNAAQGEHIRTELVNQMADGTIRYVDFSIKPLKDEAGNVIYLIAEGWEITRLKETEAALQESENKFHQIFDKANDGIEIIELRDDGYPGNYIDVNEVACRMVGYTRDEMLQMSPIDISTDINSRPFDGIIKEIHALGQATFETEHVRKDGTVVPVEVSTLIETLLGRKVFLSIIRDITERKAAEKALQESERKNTALIDALPDIMFIISREGVYHDFKVVDSDMLAIPPEQIIGKNICDTGFKKETEEVIMRHIEEALRTKTLQQFEYDLPLPQGIHDYEVRLVALNENEVLGIVRDITDRKQTERELQKLASIVRHSGEFISLATPDGMMIFLNEAGAKMLGTTPEEAITHPILYFVPDHLKEQVTNVILPSLKEEDSWDGDFQYLNHTTGSLLDVHMEIFPILDPATGELLYLANASLDITERKKAEKALQEANRKLNLLSSITRHDIINQVSAAQVFVEVMEMEGEIPPDSKIAEDLRTIDGALKTIERQIVFTRDYQDLGMDAPKWYNVGDIVETVAFSGSKVLKVENKVKNLEIYADPLFEKVIYNLFDNAARHGEKITTIRFRSEESQDGFRLICEDDGVGVPADVKDKIFNRQYFKHTGLGLFLSQEILSITGMSIAETGVPGEGARFEITVPDGMWRLE